MINSLLSCTSPPDLSMSRYCDPDVDDKAQEAGELQASSPGAAADKWAEADQTIVDAAPIVPVAIQGYAQFVSQRVGNFQFNAQYYWIVTQSWVK